MTRLTTIHCDVCAADLTVAQRADDGYYLEVTSDLKRQGNGLDPVPRARHFCDWQCLGNYARTQR